MASNTVTGDRKWASATTRRGGMTVLGKVAVPKPINLPSQRLENHGLDPSVEIVPKGTLSWGSRSSAGSNAWGVSASPPDTDGSSSSHSLLAGRPSSGGGTRPSTAGSDKAHDSNFNAWSSNTRPSSASGVLASNNASVTSLRPHSAETKPGSSHLSRFAGPLAESSGSWGSCAAPERIEASDSGKDGFSLTSGDFPTLGSEKDESRKIMEPRDVSHRRPGSSSGVTTLTGCMEIVHGDNISKNADSEDPGRKDGPSCVEDGPRPSMDRCYGEPHLYQNPNMTPPHYDSWRGAPPVNAPGAIWFRSPRRPPYGPGGFPIDPFPYYRPQVQGPGLANSPPVPPPGASSHGHFSKNGDIYRPHMSEPYMHPSMPIRPGFYPSPVPYEGYYGPPMGFHNPNERDLPFMGMPNGRPVYNRPVHPNVPDPNFSHSRPSEGRTLDHVEPVFSRDPQENSNILRKQTDGRNQNDEQKWGNRGITSSSNGEKGILSLVSVPVMGWEDDYKKNEDMQYTKSAPTDGPVKSGENNFGSSNPANLKFSASVKNVEDANTSHVIENATSPKDNSLIQKIESLNAKARASVGRRGGLHTVEQHEEIQTIDTRANESTGDADFKTVLEHHNPSGVLVAVPHEIHFGTVGASHEFSVSSVTASSRKSAHGAQNRGDHHGKGGSNEQGADGRRRRSESSSVAAEGLEFKINPAEVPKPNVEKKGNYESSMPTFKPSDAQCAKMREPKQQTSQVQKEEKEWVREKKIETPAKLEELNQCSRDLATNKSGNKVGSASVGNDASCKPEGSKNKLERRYNVNQSTRSSSASSDNIAQAVECRARSTVLSAILPMHVGAETKKTAHQDSALSKKQLPTADLDINDNSEVSKHKWVDHKHRQNTHLEKIFTQDSIPAARKDVVKDPKESCEVKIAGAKVVSGTGNQTELPHSLLLLNQKKNKSVKNKHKVAELSTEVSSSGDVVKDNDQLEVLPELEEQNACSSNINSSSILPSVARETHSSSSHEDAHGRPNNLWKPQNSRKHRNSLSYRSTDKSHSNDAFVWAPVRSIDKVEAVDQINDKIDEPSAPVAIGDNLVSNNLKIKRAEMERYIPRPVAKELAQQGSVFRAPSSSVDQAAINGTDCRLKASQSSDYVGKAGSSAESKHADGKNSQRTQGSWRQRVSAESITAQTSIERSSTAPNFGKDFHTSYVCEQNVKPDESSLGGPSCRSDDEPSAKGPQTNFGGEWNGANDSGRKDHVPFGRAKRHPRRKGRGSNPVIDHEDFEAGLTDLQHPHVETSHTERIVPSKENQAVGDRAMSHWQPKSQSYLAHNKQGNRSNSGQNFNTGDTNKTSKREADHSGDTHQENNKDKLGTSVQGLPCSPNQRSVGNVELGSFGVAEGHNEQRPSSGYRKNANYGSRFNKGHESQGDWNSTWQENKQHYSSASRERQRPNAHYEYQTAGSFNSSGRRSDDSGSQTPFQSADPKFRERGPSHVRRGRGNFHGRQRGNNTEAGTG